MTVQKRFVRCRFTNISFVPDETLSLLLELWRAGLIDGAATLTDRQHHLLGANPHFLQFGKARVLQQLIDDELARCCAEPDAPTVREMRGLLAKHAVLREHYALTTAGRDWHLVLRTPRRKMRERSWAAHGWKVVFELDGKRAMFPLAGVDFVTFGEMFASLDGRSTVDEVASRFSSHAALWDRFQTFGVERGLLTFSSRPAKSERASGVQFVSHSTLELVDGATRVLVDPCFHLLDHQSAAARSDRARFDDHIAGLADVDAILITHAHWDHCHLPTLLRVPRDTPIFVPRVTRETYYNPSIKNFLESLRFTNVHEVTHWRRETIGAVHFTPIPFHGEWFGPGSSFDAFCFVLEASGRRYLGTVDSDRDERGDMGPVFERVAREIGAIDCMFFGSSAQSHERPVACGAPLQWSNTFAREFPERMRYHPDARAVRDWCRTLDPDVIVPYAEFIFSNAQVRPSFRLDAFSPREVFTQYWRGVDDDGRRDTMSAWKRSLRELMSSLRGTRTRLLMLGPGETIAFERQAA